MAKAEILIVEDDKLSASVLKRILVKNNYNVVGILEKGEDAVKTALDLKPDLILMEFLKDKIDGIEAAGKIKENYDIPVIYLTADSSLDTIQRAKITECFGYLRAWTLRHPEQRLHGARCGSHVSFRGHRGPLPVALESRKGRLRQHSRAIPTPALNGI